MKFSLFILFCFISLSFAFNIPNGWDIHHKANNFDILRVSFAVKHKDNQIIHKLFDEISLPSGDHFREFLSLDALSNLIRPNDKIINRITQYLENIGAKQIHWTNANEFVQFYISVKDAEEHFNTEFYVYKHQISGRRLIRSNSKVNLPKDIVSSIDVTMGLQDFFDTKDERKSLGKSRTITNSPYVLMVMGSDSEAFVYFYAMCSDGSSTTNATNPCSDSSGPEIDHFIVEIHPDGFSKTVYEVPPSDAHCNVVGSDTICFVKENIAPYTRCNITTQTVYSGNSESDKYFYPTKYSPTSYVTPQLVYDTYNIPRGTRGINDKNSQAIVSFEEQYYSHDDLHLFFDSMGILPKEPVLSGFNNDSIPGGEATLDVQWIMGVGQGINTTTWSFPNGDYILNWAMAVSDTNDAPLVTSISYGDTEIGYEQKSGYGLNYIYRMNLELMKMTLRGLTVIAGSGDAGWSNVGEMGNDLSAPDESCTPGRAFYPSVSPYVMSLSSTFLTKNALDVCGYPITPYPGVQSLAVPIECTQSIGEVAVSVSGGISWTTGGGFSNVTTRHAYQEEAVNHFIKTSPFLPPSEYWNSNGQGYADISTIGWNQLVAWYGVFFPIGGTSASGPVAAGIFALINDALLEANKAPLGFINPMLYKWAHDYPDAFNDITSGKNNDGDIQEPGSQYPTFCEYGFTAQAGWDPVTGLGTPNFARLKQLALTKL